MASLLKAHNLAQLSGLPLAALPDLSMFDLGNPELAAAYKAELARLARESEIVRVEMDRYMESRDAAGDETSHSRVLEADPLTQDAIAIALMAQRRMETKDERD